MLQDTSQFASWFADFLIGFRVKRRMTVEAFALSLGVSAQLVYAYENENKPVGKATIYYIDNIISHFELDDKEWETLIEARVAVYMWYLVPDLSALGEDRVKLIREKTQFYVNGMYDLDKEWIDTSSTHRLLELLSLKVYGFFALAKIAQVEGLLTLFYLDNWFWHILDDIEDIQRRGDHPRLPEEGEEPPPPAT